MASVANSKSDALTGMRAPRISRSDVVRALAAMLLFDMVLTFGGFGRLYRIVKGLPVRPKPAKAERIGAVCDAVDRATAIYPKHALCLQRSAVAACLLRREGLAARMIIGCRKLPFMGHAWVEVEGKVVNDSRQVHHLYTELDRC